MNKKITLGIALSLVAIACAVTFILTSFFTLQSFNKKIVDVNEKSKKYNALNDLEIQVRDNYYGSIDQEGADKGILKGYIAGIGDPYSKYLTADEYAAQLDLEKGEQIGLGLTLANDASGYIKIADILPDSPAENEGLAPGDVIVAIDNKDVLTIGFDESVASMEGTEGSSLKLTIRRDGVDTDYTFIRRSIEIQSVTGEMLNGFVGYIQIKGFRKNTPDQFLDVLGRLNANGAKAFVFDLRDNSDGLMDALEECLDPLLPEGVIATASYKDGHTDTLVYSDENMIDTPMVVLVNKQTSCAAELFAASLRDFRSAKIIGVKTAGKGVIQDTIRFDDGGALIITVAECSTTQSVTFNETGIVPDTIIENNESDPLAGDSQYLAAVEAARLAIAQ
ncbi:MAG: PDZ domain-containing protein [Ruminococcus flavefaciens]|jgi:carboxyl-terminal processing protease|nr:PDZ domain-containing protein [Ruminococcus flavefaciens]